MLKTHPKNTHINKEKTVLNPEWSFSEEVKSWAVHLKNFQKSWIPLNLFVTD